MTALHRSILLGMLAAYLFGGGLCGFSPRYWCVDLAAATVVAETYPGGCCRSDSAQPSHHHHGRDRSLQQSDSSCIDIHMPHDDAVSPREKTIAPALAVSIVPGTSPEPAPIRVASMPAAVAASPHFASTILRI